MRTHNSYAKILMQCCHLSSDAGVELYRVMLIKRLLGYPMLRAFIYNYSKAQIEGIQEYMKYTLLRFFKK